MRKTSLRIATAMMLTGLAGPACAQPFIENFDDITTLASSGWFLQNNSNPVGSTSWFQGTSVANQGPFDSYNGAANAYIGANFNNTTGGSGTISSWMLTPNRVFRNGDVFQFYTRKPATPTGGTDYPDRLQVRLSTNGASTNVGPAGSGVGDFTTLLTEVNPSLVAGGYPYVWTQVTTTISGLPAPTSGRIALRYFVTSAGPLGSNSDYIGIDNAVYTPYVCPTLSVTGTPADGTWGQTYSATLGQTGALGAPNFAIVAGTLPYGTTLSAAGVISGTPTTAGSYDFTVLVSDASGCSGMRAYAITILADVPHPPTAVTATPGDAQISVDWDAPAVDGGDPITGYTATCTDGVDSRSTSVSTAPAVVADLTNGMLHTCRVTASNGIGASAGSDPSAPVTPMGEQTITFDPQADRTYSPGGSFPIAPAAVASSGLAVTYGSATSGICTVSDGTVSIVAAGTCTITADQAGNAAWNPAPQAVQSLTITRAGQTLTFPPQTTATRWLKVGSTFAIAPLASSAQPNAGTPIVYASLTSGICSVGGTTVTMIAEGVCRIAADQAGDDNYTAAAQQVVQVTLVQPTEADLWVVKSAWKSTAVIGDSVGYSIDVGNLGPAHAANVRVLDVVPARLNAATVTWQCVSAVGTSCPVPGSGVGTLDLVIATLPRDASLGFEFSGVVLPAADPANDFTPFDNTASVSLPSGSALTDPVPGNNASTATITVLSRPDALFTDGFDVPQR